MNSTVCISKIPAGRALIATERRAAVCINTVRALQRLGERERAAMVSVRVVLLVSSAAAVASAFAPTSLKSTGDPEGCQGDSAAGGREIRGTIVQVSAIRCKPQQ